MILQERITMTTDEILANDEDLVRDGIMVMLAHAAKLARIKRIELAAA